MGIDRGGSKDPKRPEARASLGTEVLFPSCPCAAWDIKGWCCMRATAICQTADRAQPSLVQDGQLALWYQARREGECGNLRPQTFLERSQRHFSPLVSSFSSFRNLFRLRSVNQQDRKDHEGGHRRTFFSPEKSHLSLTTEEREMIVVIVT